MSITAVRPERLSINDDQGQTIIWGEGDMRHLLARGREASVESGFGADHAHGGIVVIGHNIDNEAATEVWTDHPGHDTIAMLEQTIETLQTLAEGLRRTTEGGPCRPNVEWTPRKADGVHAVIEEMTGQKCGGAGHCVAESTLMPPRVY